MAYTCLLNLVQLDPLNNGGTSIVAYEVTRALLAQTTKNPALRLVIAVNARMVNQFEDWLGEANHGAYILTPLDFHEPTAALLHSIAPNLIVSPIYGASPFNTDRFPHVVFMPDALPLEHPEYFPARQLSKRRQFYADLHRATVVVAPTEDASQRLKQHTRPPIQSLRVIPYGADRLDNIPADNHAFRPSAPYLFYPASSWEHKNHDFLFQVMERVWQQRPNLQLVLTGGRTRAVSAKPLNNIQQGARQHANVHDLGFVTPEHLKALYQHAEALVFPSSYEGLGIPVLEAMHLGCPVICSDATCLPEVTGPDAAVLLPVGNVDEWANAICNRLPEARNQLIDVGHKRAAQFPWQQTGDQLLTLLHQLGLPPPDETHPTTEQTRYVLQTVGEYHANQAPPPPEIPKMTAWHSRLQQATDWRTRIHAQFRVLVLIAKLLLRLMRQYLRP